MHIVKLVKMTDIFYDNHKMLKLELFWEKVQQIKK